jgi:positive regulator of sigma E activity
VLIEAENTVGSQVGDKVLLKLNPGAPMIAILMVFGLPLLMLFLGAVLADIISVKIGYENQRQIFSIAGGASLFLLSFIPLKIYDKRSGKSEKCNAVITEVLKKAV